MLIDEKDLLVLENSQCRAYFEEILQSYYSKNYRATIVLLYSFVIYDLYMKLQTMANEGNASAQTKTEEIKTMIADEEKYSKVEKAIIEFFMNECALYFKRFDKDIIYLRDLRNNCAHLKVDDNSLFVPEDYQVRMLICSMFDNILSVKAPFITNLFDIAQSEVERYSGIITYLGGFTENIQKEITNNYLVRMTDESLKKSYNTFLTLLLVKDTDDCKKYTYGLYAFSYSLTEYLIKKGKVSIINEVIEDITNKIDINILKGNNIKTEELIELIKKFTLIFDILQTRDELKDFITRTIFLNPIDFGTYYQILFPRTSKTIYEYFMENTYLHRTTLTQGYYNAINQSPDFIFIDYLTTMIKVVPSFNGFNDADCFMNCVLNNLTKLTLQDLDKLRSSYYGNNNQLYGRFRNVADIQVINNYITTEKAKLPSAQQSLPIGIAWI